jgi:hypothetical protein
VRQHHHHPPPSQQRYWVHCHKSWNKGTHSSHISSVSTKAVQYTTRLHSFVLT